MTKTPHWLLTLAVAACATSTLMAQTPPRAPLVAMPPVLTPVTVTLVTEVEGITEYRLPNGLQLLLVPDDSKPSTTVNVTYKVGSKHESYGETGMAHLLEHLIFKGTPTTRNVWAEFTKRGMRPNGSTSFDRTNYFASFSANDETLRWYLSWQADAMLNSFIARADLDTEMTVVRNEMEMGENNPGRVLLQQTMAAMYQWHNYGKSVIGARSDVENVDIPRLQAFYRQYYQPDNATLIVSGRFNTAQVLAWVAQFFGPLPKPTRTLATSYTLDPVQDGERSVTLRRNGGTPLIYMAYHVPPAASADFAAASLLAQVLGDTPGGRLHKRLVEKQLAASTFAFAWGLAEPGPFFLGASLAPGQDVGPARAAMEAAAASLLTQPVTAEELERARTQLLNAWDQGFADPEAIGVQISSAIALGDWRLYFLEREQIKKITLADIQRVATERLKPDNRTVGIYLPTEKPDRAPAPARVDVAALLKDFKGDATAATAEAFEATPANIEARTQSAVLQSGLKLSLLPKGTRGRAVQATLQLHYGTEASLRGQETVATFAAALIDKGGAGLTRQQIADQFDRLQAEVGFSASDQTLSVSLRSKREHLPALVTLVGKLLREPNFAPAPLEEMRRQWLSAIERQRKEPEAVIGNRLARHANPYPRGDLRYESTFEESEQDVRAVTLAQVQAFQKRFYSAAKAEFSAIGDFDAVAVKAAVTSAFGDWRQPAAGAVAGVPNFVRVARPLVAAPAARFIENTPDKQNANLQGGLSLALNERHPDHAALMLANHIFGSGGSSRLWRRIRETDGLSYDVRSVLSWASIDNNTAWNVSAIFAPQNLAKVETALREELARSLKDGFTEQELSEGRSGLLSQRRLGRAQDGAVVGWMVRNLYLERSFMFSQQIDDQLGALTLAQVNAAWRQYIVPAQLVLAWGGDFKPAP